MCDSSTDVCRVGDDRGSDGMERNMGEQVNKAFEVYRKASIEKDLAKKELEKTVTRRERSMAVWRAGCSQSHMLSLTSFGSGDVANRTELCEELE